MHVVAQQLMGLVLQQRGLGIREWRKWIGGLVRAAGADEESVDAIIRFMLQELILTEDSGILGMGPEGERLYGGRNYMELLSVFQTPPLLRVICGAAELGSVHPLSLRKRNNESAVLSLAGRSWQVVSVNYPKGEIFVVPADEGGKSRWLGTGQALSFVLCQMIRNLLLGEVAASSLSRRAEVAITELRSECRWVEPDATVVLRDSKGEGATWWTFAGLLANVHLAAQLGALAGQADNFSIRLIEVDEAIARIHTIPTQHEGVTHLQPRHEVLKFEACLPQHTLANTIHSRMIDMAAMETILETRLVIRTG
jgi:ATP-dependent Lhr-like helicase